MTALIFFKSSHLVLMDRQSSQIAVAAGETSRLLVEFLQVAITSIVFLKGIYPPGGFERRRYMNLVVHRARHPQLNHYIHNALNQLLPYIQQGMVERVAVIFFNRDKIPMERFMLKINVKKQCYGEMMDLESSLRSFLIKLQSLSSSSSSSSSSKIGGDCEGTDWRWEITGYFMKKDAAESDDDRWIPTGTQQWQQPPLITPIKSLNMDPFSLQLYLEHPTIP